jgi:D-arginine dehydrogenase
MRRMSDTHRFDAIVVGAGIAGAAAAAHLAETHPRLAILEAEESAGYHSTGRSAALWILNYGPPDARAMSAASRGFLESPPAGFGDAPLTRRRAVVFLAPAAQRAHLAEMVAAGEGLEWVDPAEIRAAVPALRPDYAVAAAIERDAFDIDVAALHQGFLRQVRACGGTLALRHRAARIAREGGVWRVEVEDGAAFAAPLLVNAAGAWGDAVARLAGLAPLGLQPKRRTALIVDPGPYDCADWPLLNDADHTWYVRPEARRKLLVSPADETDMAPCDAQPEELDVAIAIERMRQALDIPVRRVEHRWAGLRTFTPDRSLAIGAGEAEGFYWMCGQGGYGIQTAPAAGRLLAALVSGRDPGPDLARVVPLVDPRRFTRGGAR